MRVQKAILPSGNYTWIVLDDSFLPIEPVHKYLSYLNSINRSPNTIKTYAHALKLFWTYINQENLKWTEVGLSELSNFLSWLHEYNSNLSSVSFVQKKRSERSINLLLTVVGTFYEYQHRLGLIKAVPLYDYVHLRGHSFKPFLYHINKSNLVATNVLKIKAPKYKPLILSRTQVKKIMEICDNQRDKFLVFLLYETGMRIGQVLGLWHEDIHSWDNEILIVPRKNHVNGMRAKTINNYIIHVSKELIDFYTDYLLEEFCEATSSYVFINLWGGFLGKAMSYSSIQMLFRRLSRKLGFKVTPHIFRHTHATELLRAGWDMSYVQRRLGHKQIQTTINAYAHIANEDLKKEYSKYLMRRGQNEQI